MNGRGPVTRSARLHGRGGLRVRRRAVGDDTGFTVIEMTIAMFLGVAIIALVMVSLSSTLRQAFNGSALAQANGSANLALQEIQRDILSADVIFAPTVATAHAGKNSTGSTVTTGFGLRMLTYVGQPNVCVQWRVLKSGYLQRRWWPTGQTTRTAVHPWITVVKGIKNTSSQKVFVLNTNTPSTYGGRLLGINLYLRSTATTNSAVKTDLVQASYAARDAEFFASSDTQFCSTIPSTTS